MSEERTAIARVGAVDVFESHPFNHLGLGELPYLIIVRAQRLVKDRNRLVDEFRQRGI